MIPETLGASAICLYKADDFPTRWSLQQKLIDGAYADPSLVRFNDLWWLFVCSTPYSTRRCDYTSRAIWLDHGRNMLAVRSCEGTSAALVPRDGSSSSMDRVIVLPRTVARITEHTLEPLKSTS